MQQLPQIVRERLRTPARSEHPDADVLTAFAERSLPGPERALVMEHLARCGDCREVLSLALPEMEEVLAPVALRRPWLSMTALRWGAITAGLVIVVLLGVEHRRPDSFRNLTSDLSRPKDKTAEVIRQPVTTTEARNEAMPDSAAISGDNAAATAKANSNASALGLARPNSVHSRNRHVERTARSLKDEPEQVSAGGGFAPKRAQPSSSMPAPSETVTVASASAQTASDAQETRLAQSQSEAGQDSSEGDQVVAKAKALVNPQVASAAQSASNSAPRWTITSAGGLRRSFDQGKTWQDISVTTNATPSPALPIFRSISTAGVEVWAGAAGGVLYHSLDAGENWISAIPSDRGILLTGDIVSVQFTDSLHGRLSTSTSETWTTADGGQHWSKQQI